MHEEIALRMLAELRRHAANDADVVRERGHVRKEFAYRHTALAALMKRPMRRLHRAVVVELGLLHLDRHGLPGVFFQKRLRIKRIDVRDPAAHVAKDHAACLRRKTLRATDRRLRMQQTRQRGHAKAGGGIGEELAA